MSIHSDLIDESDPGRANIRLGLMIVVFLYIVIYGALLFATNGLPYVFDNNETFSSIVHAKNMLTYGVGETYGLTDESYGNTPESHPYVYTHQGNFPRLFAALIYLLGARSAEAQIAVTTFTIGLIAIGLAYNLIARRAGWLTGVTFCVLMMTDYVMIAQWQVVTWRVWHMFFFFLCLQCADRIVSSQSRLLPWWIGLIVGHACLFYFELIYAAFTAATTCIFAFLSAPRRIWLVIRLALAQAVGAILGIGILVSQLIAYLGWDNFITDLHLTYYARNESGELQTLEKFMLEHHIVFWFNINKVEGLRQFETLLKNFLTYSFGVYTPGLVCIAVTPIIGIVFHRLTALVMDWRPSALRTRVPEKFANTVVLGSFALFAVYIITGFNVAAVAQFGSNIISMMGLSAVALLLGASLRTLLYSSTENGYLALYRFVPGVMTLGGALYWMMSTETLYGNLTPLWVDAANRIFPEALQIMALFSGWTAIRIACWNPPGRRLFTATVRLSRVLAIPASAFLAFAVVYMLSPGYVLTGYLQRYAPFTAFANVGLLTIGFTAVIHVLYDDLVRTRNAPWYRALCQPAFHGVRVWPFPRAVATGSGLALIGMASGVLLPSYWLALQTLYLERLPPDHAAVIQELRNPMFAGASFVVNTYAAPVAVQTGEWAYLDAKLGYLVVDTTDGKNKIAHDLQYLWLTDRGTNTTYMRPQYFLCFAPQDMSLAAWPEYRKSVGCSKMPIVRMAGQTIAGVMSSHLVAMDETDRDRWAIVKLDWHE